MSPATHGPVEVEMRTASLPLVRPFRTSRGEETHKDVLLLGWSTPEATGWAECGADPEPTHYPEYIDTVRSSLTDVLIPLARRVDADPGPTLPRLRRAFADVPGLPLAKAVVETAVLEAELRATGMPLTTYLGARRDRVDVGVSVGIPGPGPSDTSSTASLDELLTWVGGYLDEGYRRIKLKIRPGWDAEPIRAVREAFGSHLPLQVDANQAYTPADIPHLLSLDEFGMVLLEQPFPADDLLAHARLAADLRTPVALDESVTSLGTAATAIALGAADVVNIKPARVGGYLTARSVHDLCVAHGIPVFCGGMLETGIGRAANLALACLPGFTLPGDISATNRYFAHDITQSFELVDGRLAPPTGPGSGARIDLDALDDATTSRVVL